jgi:hypothetical protein
MAFAEFPERHHVGCSQRDVYQLPRARMLTAEDEAEIQSTLGARSLRELAAALGASHETVRAIGRRTERSA